MHLILAGLLTGASLYAQNGQVQAYVDRNRIGADEYVNFTIELEGATDFPSLTNPAQNDFIVVSGPNQSSNIQIINGAMKSSITVKWGLAPRRTGELTIPPIEFRSKNKKYKTTPISVTVVESSQKTVSPPSRQSGQNIQSQPSLPQGSKLFLKATPSRTTVYRGEELIVTFDLYFDNVRNFTRQKLPEAQGFWIEEFPAQKQPVVTTEVVDGVAYRKAELQRLALFPTKTGDLVIDPMLVDCEVMAARQRSRSIFDDFFSDNFFGATKVQSISSTPVKITVKPLPEQGQPGDFSGSVGDFSIVSSIDTLQTSQDQAVTLTYVIRGSGNINSIKLPPPKLPASVELFEPKIERETNNRGNHIQGTVKYEYVLIPRSTGTLEIPVIRFVYFDPSRGQYRTVNSRSFSVKVNSRVQNYVSSADRLFKEEIAQLGSDIRFISRSPQTWNRLGSSVFSEFWFWFLNVLAALIAGTAVFYRSWSEKMETNIAFSRRRRAWSNAQGNLQKAETALAQSDYAEFFTRLDRTLAGFVGDRLGLSQAEVGLDRIAENLQKKKADADLIRELVDFLRSLETDRFSPGAVSNHEYNELLETAKSILAKLNKVL